MWRAKLMLAWERKSLQLQRNDNCQIAGLFFSSKFDPFSISCSYMLGFITYARPSKSLLTHMMPTARGTIIQSAFRFSSSRIFKGWDLWLIFRIALGSKPILEAGEIIERFFSASSKFVRPCKSENEQGTESMGTQDFTPWKRDCHGVLSSRIDYCKM